MKRLVLLLLLPSLAFATESPCDYDHKITGKFTKEIQKVDNIRREVFPHKDGARKCVITLNAWVDGNKHEGDGEFTFGPDITENKACSFAEQRAKENIIKRVSPEILSSSTNMSCGQNKRGIVAIPGQYAPGTIIPIEQLKPYTVPTVPYVYYDSKPAEVQVINHGGFALSESLRWGISIFSLIRR